MPNVFPVARGPSAWLNAAWRNAFNMITPHLFIPGPTTIPDAVRMAMNLQMEDMRSPEIPKFTLPIFEDLKKVF